MYSPGVIFSCPERYSHPLPTQFLWPPFLTWKIEVMGMYGSFTPSFLPSFLHGGGVPGRGTVWLGVAAGEAVEVVVVVVVVIVLLLLLFIINSRIVSRAIAKL